MEIKTKFDIGQKVWFVDKFSRKIHIQNASGSLLFDLIKADLIDVFGGEGE